MVRLSKDIPVASNVLDRPIVHLQGNVESNHAVALFDDFQNISGYISELRGAVEEEGHLFKEPRFTMFILLRAIGSRVCRFVSHDGS